MSYQGGGIALICDNPESFCADGTCGCNGGYKSLFDVNCEKTCGICQGKCFILSLDELFLYGNLALFYLTYLTNKGYYVLVIWVTI